MRAWVAAFLVGVLTCQTLFDLPSPSWFLLLIPLILAAWQWPLCRVLLAFSVGFFWTVFRADLILSEYLPESLESREIVVEGRITGLPEISEDRTRFEFLINKVEADGRVWPAPGKVRLNWYQARQTVLPGQQWRLTVKLKRPHSYMNPDGFDYESWMFQQRLRALGYVRHGGENRLLIDNHGFSLGMIRLRLAEKIEQAMDGSPMTGLVMALAIGARHRITQEQWEVMRRTGTNHLMAISGLHIGFVALLTVLLVRWFGRFLAGETPLRLPLPYVASILALCVAGLYASLAGFAIPTQRAFIMVAIGLFGLLFARQIPVSYTLATALFVVLVWDPIAVLAPGFWLSFGAVAFIFYGLAGRLSTKLGWLKMQWWIFIGLIPLLLIWFDQVSLISPIVNPIAIAMVVFTIVPTVLAGTILIVIWPLAGWLCLHTAGWLLTWLWAGLTWAAEFGYALWTFPALPLWVMFTTLIGTVILLLPRGFPARIIGLVWLLPAVFWAPPKPPDGQLWLTILDVDQGLSAVVQTAHHTLVYDAGVRFRNGSDMAQSVIMPFLQAQGIHTIEQIIISHGDNDHAGGAPRLLSTFPETPMLTSAIDKFPQADTCKTGQSWQWDRVQFDILHPQVLSGSRNDQSCVLRISLGEMNILLPGDIERSAEYALLAQDVDIEAEILIAPHHGSRSSSSEDFIEAVMPQVVVFTTGYRNRYGFPKPDIVTRYVEHGASPLNTGLNGAIHIQLDTHGIIRLDRVRQNNRRYWHTRLDAPLYAGTDQHQ